jgi:CBS domain-containing protein
MIETTVAHVEVRTPEPVTPDTPVAEAAQSLRRVDVPALPVVEDDAVVGILTESDVVAMVAETADRPVVGAVMSSPVATITPTATLTAAAETMRSVGVEQLAVVDDGIYCGVLSATTVAPFLSRRALDIEWCDASPPLGGGERHELVTSD